MAPCTHPGGIADKAGFAYESLWGIFCMLEILNGTVESIHIEKIGEDGAEFCIQRGDKNEYWQTKRQITGQQVWSLKSLKEVLLYFLQKFRDGECCVFASVSDAPDLRMLTENAKSVRDSNKGLPHLKEYFLNKNLTAKFVKLQQLMGDITEEETFGFLCSITVHGGREITLESFFSHDLSVMFQSPWQTTMDVLRGLYLDGADRVFTAIDIETHLEERDIKKRHYEEPDAQDKIYSITNSYVSGQRTRLIRGTPIVRSVTENVLDQIKASDTSLDILITAPAGGGKSACLCQIVERLQAAKIPTLAFRLDRIDPVQTLLQLGEKLGLGESPAFVLSEAFRNQPVVLVIDQVDCVSTSSGRHPDFFDTIAAFRDEIVGLRIQRKIHLVLACRKFDFKYDHRLKQLLPKDQQPIELGELTLDEIKNVIQQEGGTFSKLTSQQQTMLRLPQNLALYIAANLVKSNNRFSTPKELCDKYWHAKRKVFDKKHPEFGQHWMPALTHLSEMLSKKQELSVPVTSMDKFPPAFLDIMVSEGVFSLDGQRYGFGHETFFDYCFARTQLSEERDFIKFLENDDQHLFRRAQLRQVLAFLRGLDFGKYLNSVNDLLISERIRPHLKILAVELLAEHPDARDEELELLMPWINNELNSRSKGSKNPDVLSSRIWDRFFFSPNLFVIADRTKLLDRWLDSNESWLQDLMAMYLRQQVEENAERIAEILEPFVGNNEWRTRLRYIMEGRRWEKSRRFFDLFLRLLDDGTLDEAKERLAVNGTFFSMFYTFAEERPEWYSELAARWLDRQVALTLAIPETSRRGRSYFNDEFGVDELLKCARAAPKIFLQNVLPAILRAATACSEPEEEDRLAYDRLWPIRFNGKPIGLLEAFPSACETAFELIAQSEPEALRQFLDILLQHPLLTANHLLMNAYLTIPRAVSEEVMKLFIAEPKRLVCGFSGSPYWLSYQLLNKCSPYCTNESFRVLEARLLEFVSPYERGSGGFRFRGHTAFNLVSALAKDRLSVSAKAQLRAWEEKHIARDGPPAEIHCYSIKSPIQQESAKHMTDKQWLKAIKKYHAEEYGYNHVNPEKGGARQLARMLEDFTKENPERFALLTLQFPRTTHPCYFSCILDGIKDAAISSELKLTVARKIFEIDDRECFRSTLHMLGSITDITLPKDIIHYIQRAAKHVDPEPELLDDENPHHRRDILTCGINSVRGIAAGTIASLISTNASYLKTFQSTINKLVTDPSLAVRSCVATTLHAVAQHDAPRAFDWGKKLLDADDRLLATAYVRDFIHWGIYECLSTFAPVIKRMLCSVHDTVKETGGELACLARFYNTNDESLIQAALKADASCRLGVCSIVKDNFLKANSREWCEDILKRLFNDENQGVREKAAGCFWHLWHSPETPLTDFNSLIQEFLQSAAFIDDPNYLLYTLEATKCKVPDVTLDVCEIFITRCSEEARDIRTSTAAVEPIVGNLVFSAYTQLQTPIFQERALNLIDQMSLAGLGTVSSHFTEFER